MQKNFKNLKKIVIVEKYHCHKHLTICKKIFCYSVSIFSKLLELSSSSIGKTGQ